MPTGEPKDTPRHGFCLAHVHVHRCDLLLYLFIFLFRELSPFSFLVRLPQVLPFLSSLSFSRSLQPSVSPSTGNDATRGIPCVLSDIRVCMCLGCSGTEVILTTACTQSPPSYVDRLSSLLSISLALEELPLVFIRAHCQDLLLAFPKMRTTPCHHVGHFFSELAGNGKEGF